MEVKNYFAQDSQGNAQPNATCYLYAVGTETLVTGLTNISDQSITNPFHSDSFGLIQFKAPNGLYDLRVVSGVRDYRIRVQCNDLNDVVALVNEAADTATTAANQAIVSAAETATKVAVLRGDLANSTDPLKGSSLSGYKGRSVYDRLAETVYIKDAPFNAKMDGITDDSAAASAFFSYLKINGGRGELGDGILYCKTFRFKASMSEGIFKPFSIYGNGENTTIKFGNISPILNAGGTAVVTSEPRLIDIIGTSSGSKVAPRCRFSDFTIDYSEQVYKGGASASTPALTDIKPLSNGVNVFSVEYADGIEIENITIKEVYGNGIILSRCPNSRITNVRGFNVSGGNPGLADSNGGFVAVMRGSQIGTSVTDCWAINTRQFQTDTVGGFNNITAKNTLCGYIGFWTEYGSNTSGTKAPGTDLWLNITQPNDESFGCVFTNCFAFGYTIGFKAESHTPTTFNACTAINCWIPFLAGASRGRAINCYADCAAVDGLQCPQSGYEYVRAMYVHYNVSGQPYDVAGFTFDGCMSYVRNCRVYVTNTNDGKFINQQTIIDHTDNTRTDPQVFTTRAVKLMSGAEFSGTLVIKNLGKAISSVIYDMQQMVMDLNIINMSDFQYTINPNQYVQNAGCDFSDIRIRSKGLVRLGIQGSRGCRVDYVGVMTDITKSFSVPPVSLDGTCEGCDVTVDLTLHSASVPTAQFGVVAIQGSNSNIDISLTVVDAGSNTLDAVLFTNAVQSHIRSIRKFDDVYKIPLIKPGTSGKVYHVAQAFSNDSGPLFDANYGLRGPITLGSQISVGSMTKATMSYEPNAIDRISKDTTDYVTGVRFDYIKPVLSGKEGMACYTSGRIASAWAATTAVTVGTYRQTGSNVYRCSVAGTTDTVAPSHTTGSATDGTVTWDFVSPQAKFVEYGLYSAALL